ncbi:MAG: T9SS type A sorting domain-containing protein [Bacteroidetes bacterium]|nr:T9SS type A sorting domain-containing protein [Bacteroidota bacterium]MCL2302606.1 T9SS type A sorting domain-containing protein [Lentimicrobiaceae bacterium]
MKKIIIVLITALALSIGAMAQTWPPAGMNGNGSETNPYQIKTHQHLKDLADYVNAGNGNATLNVHYKLMSHLDLSSYTQWTPIASGTTATHYFQGNFNGNSYTIKNLTRTGTVPALSTIGLFGSISAQGAVSNLGVVDVNINIDGGLVFAGGIAANNQGVITNSYVTGNIANPAIFTYSGGIAGSNNGDIRNCYSTANVKGATAGGIVGGMPTGTGRIEFCYATGKIEGETHSGGIVGSIAGDTKLRNCVAANSHVTKSAAGNANIGRVGGNVDVYVDISRNYALNTMILQASGSNVTPANNHAGKDGATEDLATLQSANFYTNSNNWGWANWNFYVWKICEGKTFPFFLYQNIACSPIPAFCGGNGTVENPFQICTPQDLKTLADYINNGDGDVIQNVNFILMNDLDLSVYANGEGWNPIGNNWLRSTMFTGNFNGNNKVIKNLKINRPEQDLSGLFGAVGNGTIENLGIENCDITGYVEMGGLAGYIEDATIRNCYTTGKITGYNNVGGLLGEAWASTITNCYSTAVVTAEGWAVGGLIGDVAKGTTLSYCYASGNVTAEGDVGGLIGVAGSWDEDMPIIIRNCIAANQSITAKWDDEEANDYINRLIGNTGGYYLTLSHNYANKDMIVTVNGVVVSSYGDDGESGSDATMAQLQSSVFYSTVGNWHTSAWSIANPNGIWKICDGENMLPFLRWQGIACEGEVGIATITNDELRITVFPNPTTGELSVFSSQFSVEGIEIFDVYGKNVRGKFPSNSLEGWQPQADGVVLNISHLPSGIYFLQIKTAQGLVNKKVIKN